MRPAFNPPTSDRPGALLGQRGTALGLVVAAHVLLLFMLLRLAPPPPPLAPALTVFELLPEPERPRERKVAKAKRRAASPSPTPPTAPVVEPYELPIIPLTRAEFAVSDIAKLPARRQPADSADADADAADPADAAFARGRNGERLYAADWVREPTNAELSYYLPNGAPRVGWAIIACQTADDFRVENCYELGQSPAGSGLAAGIREAAWQFRVLPPRLGGRAMIGAWVRIRIEFSQKQAD